MQGDFHINKTRYNSLKFKERQFRGRYFRLRLSYTVLQQKKTVIIEIKTWCIA